MLQRIREVMKKRARDTTKLGGSGSVIEADENVFWWCHKEHAQEKRIKAEGRGPYRNKTIVQGILDRDLRKVRATVVSNVTRETCLAVALPTAI